VAEDIASLGIRITTDGARQAVSSLSDVERQSRRTERAARESVSAFERVSGSLSGVSGAASAFGRVYGVLIGALATNKIIEVADAFTNVASRLNLATGSIEKAAIAQQRLFEISQQTRNSYLASADVFARFATSTQQLGISQDRLFGVTKTLNQAITLSGSSAQSAQAAMIQLGQGIAAGALRGEELNSVLEQTPAVARAIADGLGVPVGALKKLGEQGKITSEAVIQALEKMAVKVDSDFNRTTVTVGQAFTQVGNSAGQLISTVDKATGATGALAKSMTELSKVIDEVAANPETAAQLKSISGVMSDFADRAKLTAGYMLDLFVTAQKLTTLPIFGALFGNTEKSLEGIRARQAELNQQREGAGFYERGGIDRELAALKEAEARALLNQALDLEAVRRDKVAQKAIEQTKAATAETEEQKKAREEYEKLIAAVRSKIAFQEQEIKLGRELTEAERLRFEGAQAADKANLTGARRKTYLQDIEQQALNAELIAQQREGIKLREEMTKRTNEYNEGQQKRLEDVVKATEKVAQETAEIELQTASIGKSKEEIQQLLIARENQRIEQLETMANNAEELEGNTALAKSYREQAKAVRDLQAARGRLGARQAEQDVADRQKKAFEGLYTDLQRGITDALFRGFERGKGFLQSFKDAIRNAFKSFIIKFAVQPVIGSVISGIAGSLGFSGLAQAATKELGSFGSFGGIGGASGGAAGSSGGFGLAEAGGLKSIYDGIAGGVQGLSNGATVAGFKLSKLAGFADDTAASIGNFAGSATTAISAAGIAYGGYQLGRGISGGYSLNGGTGNSTVNVGAAVGVGTAAMISQATAAAGGAAFGPVGYAVGAALGAILGGTVNKLFGSKRVLGASGIQGEFADGQFVGQTFQDVQIKRKLRSDKNFTQFGSIDGDTLNLLADSFQALTDSAKSTTRVLGKDLSAAIDAVRISGRFQVSTQEQFKATLDRLSDEIIKQTIPAVEAFRQTGENLIQTAARLSAAVTTANTTAVLLGQSAQFGIDNAAAALSLQANLGDQASQLEGVLSQFVPAAVLARRQLEVFRTSLRNIGLESLITTDITREQFGALLEQIDLTSEAGQRELATLLSLAPVVSQMIQRREAEAAATEQTNAVLDRLIRGVSGTTNAFVDADAAINQTRLALFNTTDIQTRLGLEAQLGQQIVARYELEMQLLGALQAGLSELQVNIGGERGNVQGAIANIIGTPLQMSAQQISQAISGASSLAQLPSLSNVSAASASVAQNEAALANIAGARQSLSGANSELNNSVASAKSLVTSFNNLSRIGSAFATTGSGGRTSARFDETLRQIIRDEYAYITFNVGDEGSVGRLRNEFNPLYDSVGGANQRISSAAGEVFRLQSIIDSEPEALRALEASQRALADAKKAFSDGIQQFVIDAGKAVGKLAKLREETVNYFEAQKQLADLYNRSASQLRDTVAGVRFSKLTEQEQLSQLQSQFSTAVLLSQSLTGDALVAQADKINSLIDPLLQLAFQLTPNGDTFTRLESSILAQAESVAFRLEDLAPKNFQQESVALLTQIDAQLAAIESNTSTAEKLIVDAINISRDSTLTGLRGIVAAIRGESVPAFASGGMFGGGLRIVGENGPELEATGPSRIFNAAQTRNILSGSGNSEMAAEIRALRQEVSQLRAENRAGHAVVAANTGKAARVLERADNGDSLNIVMVTE
jgi:tape measure domain-containing protein